MELYLSCVWERHIWEDINIILIFFKRKPEEQEIRNIIICLREIHKKCYYIACSEIKQNSIEIKRAPEQICHTQATVA